MNTLSTMIHVLLAASAALVVTMHAVLAIGILRSRGARPRLSATPLVSVLRPLCGLDESLRANLDSLTRTRYPDFEILIGIADRDDPAWEVAEQFARDNTRLPVRLICTEHSGAPNPKVAQLIELTRHAAGSVLVVSDANVRVDPCWLGRMLEVLTLPGTGLVSSIIAGAGERRMGAAIENAHLCGFVAPAVALAALLRRSVSIGKSLMLRRRDLQAIGGWESVAGVLAEDDALGQRFRSHGFAVRVSFDPVLDINSHCSAGRTLARHTRWARMRRAIAPGLFALEPLLTPTWMAALGCLISPSASSVLALTATALLQLLALTVSTRLVRGTNPSALMLLAELARPWLLLVCWGLGWASRTTTWRGHKITIGAGSAILSRDPASATVSPSYSSPGDSASDAWRLLTHASASVTEIRIRPSTLK